jgi:uncharacterized membrane protein
MPTEVEVPETDRASSDALDRAASDTLLKALYHERLLNPAAFSRARELLFPQRHWRQWILRSLLILGVTLILAGVIFFFAYNWSTMPPFAKFALIEAAILGCSVGAWFCKLETLAGKSCSLAAAILVGVFLAVFGQVYPTGADAYNLFGGWAVLISAWVIFARAPGLWFLWMLLWNVTAWTYWDHGRSWWFYWDPSAMALSLTVLNSAFLILVEAGIHLHWTGLNARWLRAFLIVAIFGGLILPVEDVIFSWRGAWIGASLALPAITVGIAYYYYRYRAPDLFALATDMLFVCVVASSVIVRVVLDTRGLQDIPEAFRMLFVGLCIVGIFAVAVLALKNMSRAMPAAASDDVATHVPLKSVTDAREMPVPNAILTMRGLLERLQNEQLTTNSDFAGIQSALFKSKDEKPTPWFVLGMIAFGAWMGSWCFFGFVFLIFGGWSGLREPSSLITMGIVWIAAAVVMSRTWEAIFFSQLALSMSAAGHALILVGVSEAMSYNSDWLIVVSLVACALCAVLNPLYRTLTHRFLSAALALIFISAVAIDSRAEFALHLVIALEFAAAGFIFIHPKMPASVRPVGFAAALALPVNFHLVIYHKNYFWWGSREFSSWPLNALAVLMVGGLVWHLTSPRDAAQKMRLLLFVCIAILGLLGGAGLLLGIALLALGYAKREGEIIAIGIATLVTFLFYYYYNLETDLLLKSLVLGGSGLLLIIVRWLYARRSPEFSEAA